MDTLAAACSESPDKIETLYLDLVNLQLGADNIPIVDERTVSLERLASPFLIFSNLKKVSLWCRAFELVAKDDDFVALSRSWRGLQKFVLCQGYKSSARGGTYVFPTQDVLMIFSDNCPDLQSLTLPYLYLDVDISTPLARNALSTHRLTHLVIEDSPWANDEDMDETNIDMWARYIHGLFPMLSVGSLESLRSPENVFLAKDWEKVLERVRDISEPFI
uniref:Zn(2)-C6 fungal-type domain-containing protein n=1 Tax=Ganoderma boninense TaxID=34458 RepID=A0A5K1K550_9APHY|nr:Zn(2)-C6 fungal-type domain-containing protein [Ganoderma boninense]